MVLHAHSYIKTKIFPPNNLIPPKPLNLATGLLYASLHFQTCCILIVLSLQAFQSTYYFCS